MFSRKFSSLVVFLSPVLLLVALSALADVPAAPVLTLYRFNAEPDVPYYHVERFLGRGSVAPAGSLAQGTTVIPCLVIHDGKPITDRSGTPFVGFRIVADARTAVPADTDVVRNAIAVQRNLRVANHHCEPGVRHVIDVRNLYAKDNVPFFDPPPAAVTEPSAMVPGPRDDTTAPAMNGTTERVAAKPSGDAGELDGYPQIETIVRDFHRSADCATVNATLTGRRARLIEAWDRFERRSHDRWSGDELLRARQLDLVMRTTLFEGHLARGCSAYGACERDVIALSIRNRALERCLAREGCEARGDHAGVATRPSQYNIWDEYLAQISGLTACFLRDDLASVDYYRPLQRMFAQSAPRVARILFGNEAELVSLFSGVPLPALKQVAHYYHAPAMGKCFPDHPRIEYLTGAIARRGNDFVLLANTRVEVGVKEGNDYRFRAVRVTDTAGADQIDVMDDYPDFLVDGRKITLRSASGCQPYGLPSGCGQELSGRYRRTPMWLAAGVPTGLTCQVLDRGAACDAPGELVAVEVGGQCDTEMRPVRGVQ